MSDDQPDRLDRDDWAALLDGVETDPAPGQVAEAVADARALSLSTAYDTVEAALADGPLAERVGGAYGGVWLPPANATDAVERALAAGMLSRADVGECGTVRLAAETADDGHTTGEHAGTATSAGEEAGSPRSNPGGETDTTGSGAAKSSDSAGLPGYDEILDEAQRRGDREPWEPVEEATLREVLADYGLEQLLETGTLARAGRWRVADLSGDDEPPDRRYYYARGHEPRPDEFRRFHDLLTESTPDGYQPHYFRVARAGKDPATQFGSWKTPDARLTVEEAVDWMEKGGNVGLAGRGGCQGCDGRASPHCPECEGEGYDDPLVNVDIDDDEETTPDDVPASLRARSRSRTGWHTWFFDQGEEPIPNIPTDDYGEIRADWQYVVAPGSFVASTTDEIPDDATDPGYYTVEHAAPVERVELDELPDVFLDALEAAEAAEEASDPDGKLAAVDGYDDAGGGSGDHRHGDGDQTGGDSAGGRQKSEVYDIEAADLVNNSDPTARFDSVFHGSSTGQNMSVSRGKLHCWRHNVAHGGLQALATLSDKVSEGCRELGAPHKKSGAGPNRLRGDWRLVWGAWHYAKDSGRLPDDDPIPHRVLLGLAVEGGVVEKTDLVERAGDTGETVDDPDAYDGDTYTALPAGTYNETLEYAAEQADVPLGRDPVESRQPTDDQQADTREIDATTDPRVAWKAAGAVTTDDVDQPLPELADAPDVVRAVALADGAAADLEEAARLEGPEYFELYDRARTEYGAPLPVYVDATRTVDDLEAATAAVEALHTGHILDALESEITVPDPTSDQVLAKINPTWEHSDSGERILAFERGPFWCAKHDQTIRPLEAVALEAGLLSDEAGRLDGRDYLDAYELARTEYDAPLPRVSWLDSDAAPDPDTAAVLPPADDLVGEFATDRGGLDAARDEVEDIYRGLADDTDTDAILSAEPSTGKSTAAVKAAADQPTLLLAPRRELQAEYVEKSNDPDIVGENPPTEYVAPVFSEPWEGVSQEAAEAAVAAIREHPDGFDLLRDGEALRQAVGEHLDPGETVEAPDPDDDTVELDRATDDTAAGEFGVEWALRVETAHALGLQPRTIHERDRELFGEPLPCSHDPSDDHGDDSTGTRQECSYTEAYNYITDPEQPIDLLIGSRVHAKVDSAKTYHFMHDDSPAKKPRAVILDEAVVDDYTTEWGDNARHVATWLASALTDTVVDGTDLFRNAHRLREGWVSPWLRGDGAEHLTDLTHRVTLADALVTLAHSDADSPAVERVRTLALDPGPVDAGDAADALDALLEVPRRDLDQYAIQAFQRLDEGGRLRDALAAVDRSGDLRAAAVPEPAPGEAFLEAVRRPFDLLADTPTDHDHDRGEYLEAAAAALDTARDLVAGGRGGTRELVVRARDGYAHPDAYLLLAGALGDGDDPLETYGSPIPNRDEPTRVNRVEVSGASVIYDRNGDGAAVTNPPEYTGGGGDCSVVGLDATPRPDLWAQYAGLDPVVVSPFDASAGRRRFVHDTRNIQVVQTDQRDVNTYSGDPSGNSFDEDLALVREVEDKYGGQRLRRDSLVNTGSPAVITTKTAEDVLQSDLEPHTADTAHYWDIAGRNDLGQHKTGVLLGAPHPGDDAIEQAALLAGEEIDPEGHGTDKDYNSPTANAMLNHAWKDQLTQAVHRFGRDKDGAIVFVHSAAVDDERLPVVANGGVTTAWSDAGTAVRDALLPYLRDGRDFTVADIHDSVEYGRRTVQQKLAEFERLGYVDRLVGGPGRANVFQATADPGDTGHVELDTPEPVDEESEQTRNTLHYTGSFGLKPDLDPSPPPTPQRQATLPPPDAPATADTGPPGD